MGWRSIGARLTAWYTVMLAGILALAAGGVWWGLRESVHVAIDRQLDSRLRAVEAYLALRPTPPYESTHWVHELSEDSMVAPGNGVVRVSDAEGRWVFRSPDAADWPDRDTRALTTSIHATETVTHRRFRVLRSHSSDLSIELALPLHPYDEVTEHFFATALVASPLLLAAAAVAGYWLSRRALRPVDAITDAAQRIRSSTRHARLPVSLIDDELRRLSLTLNAMLDRLEAEDQKSRQFTADASHELRTPVAVIRATADVTASKPRTDAEHQAAWHVIQAQASRVARMVDALLRLARADAQSTPPSSSGFDLAEEVRDLCGEMSVVAARAGLTLDSAIPKPVAFHGDADGIRSAVAAVLDNAIKYTPPGGRVSVMVEATEDTRSIVVEVTDTGIGVRAEHVPYVFDRFYRVSKDRSRESGGAGLGLTIVQAVVRQHGGHVSMTSAPGSGTLVRIVLPNDCLA